MTSKTWQEGMKTVRKTLNHLIAHGWEIHAADDDGEYFKKPSLKETIDIVDSVELSAVWMKKGDQVSCIMFIPGNGEDAVSDYSYCTDDDEFDRLMQEIT